MITDTTGSWKRNHSTERPGERFHPTQGVTPAFLVPVDLPVCRQCGERGLHGGNQDACIAALRTAIATYPARNDRMVA